MLAPLTLFLALAAPADPKAPTPAEKALQSGLLALERDRFDEAVGQLELSLRLDPRLAEAHLSLAAAHLALGQDRLAAPHLGAYLDARPGHFLARMPYAELLTKLDRLPEARAQLDRFIADAQDHPRVADEHLIASHTKLMEIATSGGDEYTERLHRGIGLYLLAVKRRQLGGTDAARLAEELLCKSAGELTMARLRRPHEARPSLYVHGVWRELGQRQPAERSLREAEGLAGLSYLTPDETRRLHLAATLRELEQAKR
ncbi:MAG: tetratricopeptide repeat protein [Gemmataceae bacterium]